MGFATHWGIENRLHWRGSALGGFPELWRLPFKDVIFGEDAAHLVTTMLPTIGLLSAVSPSILLARVAITL